MVNVVSSFNVLRKGTRNFSPFPIYLLQPYVDEAPDNG